MKAKFLILSALMCSTAFADEATANRISFGTVMRDGAVYAAYTVEGQIYVGGSWRDPSFDVNDPAAVAQAMATLPSLRNNYLAYASDIASLALAYTSPTADKPAIALAVGDELAAALAANNTGLLAGVDWTIANLTPAVAENAAIVNAINEQWTDLNNMNFEDWSEYEALAALIPTTPPLLRGKDLSLIPGFPVDALASVGNGGLVGSKLPAADLSGFFPVEEQISGADLTLTYGMTGASLANVSASWGLNGTKFPAMDMSDYVPVQGRLNGADLSRVTGFTAEILSQVASMGLDGTILPAMDLSNFVASENQLFRTDMTNTTGLTASGLTNLGIFGLRYTILPAANLSGFAPTGGVVFSADLSRVTGMTAADFTGVEDMGLYGTKLPQGITQTQLRDAFIARGITDPQALTRKMAGAIYTP